MFVKDELAASQTRHKKNTFVYSVFFLSKIEWLNSIETIVKQENNEGNTIIPWPNVHVFIFCSEWHKTKTKNIKLIFIPQNDQIDSFDVCFFSVYFFSGYWVWSLKPRRLRERFIGILVTLVTSDLPTHPPPKGHHQWLPEPNHPPSRVRWPPSSSCSLKYYKIIGNHWNNIVPKSEEHVVSPAGTSPRSLVRKPKLLQQRLNNANLHVRLRPRLRVRARFF